MSRLRGNETGACCALKVSGCVCFPEYLFPLFPFFLSIPVSPLWLCALGLSLGGQVAATRGTPFPQSTL